MPEQTFNMKVITPSRVAIDEEVVSVVIPGLDGYLGIWANHAPLMTAMAVGRLEFVSHDGVRMVAAVTNGFVEVADNQVIIIADAAELQHEINVARARQSLEQAKENLAKGKDVDLEIAQMAYERAKNRLEVAQKEIK